jgi:hypothetical protein
MKLNRVAVFAVALATTPLFPALAASSAPAASPPLEETRQALQEWVALRKLISEEENVWRAERETIQSSIDLIKSEMERLDGELKNAAESATAAMKERQRLNDDNEALKQASAAVTEIVPALEARVVELTEMFPADLRARIAPLQQRIPKRGAPSRAGTGERLQNIVGILSEVEKFNRTITKTSELQKLPNGDNAQVDTIYLGLTVAFFVDGKNSHAGILHPARGGWTATPRPELAPAIRRLVDVYSGDRLAEFVPLPVEIQ